MNAYMDLLVSERNAINKEFKPDGLNIDINFGRINPITRMGGDRRHLEYSLSKAVSRVQD